MEQKRRRRRRRRRKKREEKEKEEVKEYCIPEACDSSATQSGMTKLTSCYNIHVFDSFLGKGEK